MTARPLYSVVRAGLQAGGAEEAAASTLAVMSRHLDRCKLAARTVRAYKRQAAAYAAWLAASADAHGDAFADLVGAEGAVTAWKRDMLAARASAATVNQALAAVTLMYEQAGLSDRRQAGPHPQARRARRAHPASRRPRSAARPSAAAPVTPPSSRCCWTPARGSRNAPASTPGTSRSPPAPARSASTARATKSATPRWPAAPANSSPRGSTCAAATPGPSGPGSAARSPSPASPRSCSPPAKTPASRDFAPTAARHTFATRLRQGGADPAQVQAMLGHASIDTAARYFRAGSAENAEVVERIFSD